MSGKSGKVNSKEVGLEIGLLLAKFFVNSEDLHFGYWPDGTATGFLTFPEAQERHSKLSLTRLEPLAKAKCVPKKPPKREAIIKIGNNDQETSE